MTRLSIVVPTVSRPTLKRTLDSIAPQLHEGEEGDEVIVIGDGHQLIENIELEAALVEKHLAVAKEPKCLEVFL